ncbi:MAG: hypothetical protein HZB70_01485 [Candidatus Berkelbacteria bacterium]|nr:MAG: hypothetical protein HZB70_01485 [Candidatus Berkelbacteria bacterium]QQG51994.1 MAG: hypothetical protein HY845_01510 [Candidatus Berkelbacteria bacterium]
MLTITREYEILYALERRLVRRLAKIRPRNSFRAALSTWLFFWLIFGGFFFTVIFYLWLHSVTPPFSTNVEFLAIAGGILTSLFIGILTLSFSQPGETNWQIPGLIFFLWMVAPSIFPLLFLFGVFTAQEALAELQISPWRTVADYAFFAGGIIILVFGRAKITLTAGALTIIAISALFIIKSLISDGFYLAGRCPTTVFNENYAWLSNTSEELNSYRQLDSKGRFYRSSAGQLFCSRTREDLFR